MDISDKLVPIIFMPLGQFIEDLVFEQSLGGFINLRSLYKQKHVQDAAGHLLKNPRVDFLYFYDYNRKERDTDVSKSSENSSGGTYIMDKKFINGIFLTRNVPRVGIPLDIFTRKNRVDTYLLKKTIDVVNVNPLTEDIYEIETQQEVYTVVFAETANMCCVREINSTAYKEIKKNLNI